MSPGASLNSSPECSQGSRANERHRSGRVRHSSILVNGVTPFLDVVVSRQEVVADGFEFSSEFRFEFGLQCGAAGLIDQVPQLDGVGLVVEQQPRALQVADVGVAARAQASVFAATLPAYPLAEGRGAGDESRAVRPVFAATEVDRKSTRLNSSHIPLSRM